MKKRTVKYHPNMDMSKDSIIVREAVIKALKKLKITTEPSLELKKALERIAQPSKEYIDAMNKLRRVTEPSVELKKALEKMQVTLRPLDELRRSSMVILRATKSLNEFQQTFSDAVKLKKIIEEHERE